MLSPAATPPKPLHKVQRDSEVKKYDEIVLGMERFLPKPAKRAHSPQPKTPSASSSPTPVEPPTEEPLRVDLEKPGSARRDTPSKLPLSAELYHSTILSSGHSISERDFEGFASSCEIFY